MVQNVLSGCQSLEGRERECELLTSQGVEMLLTQHLSRESFLLSEKHTFSFYGFSLF